VTKLRRSPSPELERLLAAVYNQFQKLPDASANAKCRRDFVFHMTDWLEDLERLVALYREPGQTMKEAAGDVVYGFLIHAVPHLMEAGRLLEGRPIRNPFLTTDGEP
jgi:hypothetical protein